MAQWVRELPRRGGVGALVLLWVVAGCADSGEAEFAAGDLRYGEEDFAGAIEKWRTAAGKGHVGAMYALGRLFHEGKDTAPDPAKAMHWFRQAADRGDPYGMYGVGYLHYAGEGVDQDYEAALRWWRKAADKGHKGAIYSIGSLYHAGTGVDQDLAEALRLYRKSADLGEPAALYSIGYMFQRGEGVERDGDEAFRWFAKAADKGYADAMAAVGDILEGGQGIDRDDAKALAWHLKGAGEGHAGSLFHLGAMHYDGRGVKRDLRAAVDYFQESHKKEPDDYTAMFLWVALSASERVVEAKEFLQAYRAEHASGGWSGTVLAYMAGEVSEADLLAEARRAKDDTFAERTCEAYFYAGCVELFRGEREKAYARFRSCLSSGEPSYVEYRAARAEKERLEGS